MSNRKISNLPAVIGANIQDTDILPLVASGVTSSASIAEIRVKLGFNVPGGGRTVTSPTTYFLNNAVFNVKDFGAFGDNSHDDTAAIRLAHNAAGLVHGRVYFPEGIYLISKTIAFKHQVLWEGPSGTMEPSVGGENYGAILQFSNSISGIIIHRSDTDSDDAGVNSIVGVTTGGDGSIIRNLSVRRGDGSQPASDGTSHGIWLKARARLSNVRVEGFAGNNVNVVATSGSATPSLRGNANNWFIDGLRTLHSANHGLFIDGADVNAGVSLAVSAVNNGGWGIFDSAFLGNTHVAGHASSNTLGPYKTDSAGAHHVFVGCYSEGGGNPSSMVPPTVVIGGQHAAGFDTASPIVYLRSDTGGHATSDMRGIQAINVGATATITSRLGGDPDNGDLLYLVHSVDATGAYRFKMNSTHDLEFDYGNSGSAANVPFKISGPNTTRLFGRSVAQLHAFYTDRFWLGSGDNARQLTNGTVSPATEVAVGDIVFNRAPGFSGPLGWIFRAAGTPGTPVPIVGLNSMGADVGNASKTVALTTTENTIIFDTVITADRTVTLPLAALANTSIEYRIVRTANATGAFNVLVKDSTGAVTFKSLTAAGTWCVVKSDGTVFRLVEAGAL